MKAWESNWLLGQPMPEPPLPMYLRRLMNDIAANWAYLVGPHDYVKSVLVTRMGSIREARKVMGGLLWCGFRLRNQGNERAHLLPVCARLLYARPIPKSRQTFERRMLEEFEHAFAEWRELHDQKGSDLVAEP